ncbi:MAG: hypothetical protein AB7F28_08845 [Candidatus Margulisiibacteriota bacterium]
MIKLMPSNTYQTAALGLESDWNQDPLGRRQIREPLISTATEWATLKPLPLGEQEECHVSAAAQIRRYYPAGGDVKVVATVFSPITQAIQLSGQKTICQHAKESPQLLAEGLRCLSERTRRLLAAYQQTGVDGIFYVVQHYIQGCEAMQSLAIDLDQTLMADIPLKNNVIHLHGHTLFTPIPVAPTDWITHFDWNPHNLSMMGEGEQNPLAIGFPLETLMTAQTTQHRQDTLTQALKQVKEACNRTVGMISSHCVLPLDFPLSVAKSWVQTIQQC